MAKLPSMAKLSSRVKLVWVVAVSGLVVSFAAAAAQPVAINQTQCLTAKETRDTVAQKLVVSPAAALRTARTSAGGGQALLARLCRRDGGLIYQFSILRPDGKVVRLTLDAVAGKVVRRREGAAPRRGLKPANEQPVEQEAPVERPPGKTGL